MGIGSPSGTSISGGANSIDGKPGGRVAVGADAGAAVDEGREVGGAATPSNLPGACGPNLGSSATAAYSNARTSAVRSSCFFSPMFTPPEVGTR
ncbi:hypothetical protein CH292_14940 [Rhodococcus sp. 14-2470-1a]|nr:hypothetical protein CH292_14940 [Rhodococcus sp. 14-2470-1a]